MKSHTDREPTSTAKLRWRIFVLFFVANVLIIGLLTAILYGQFSLVIFGGTSPFLLFAAWVLSGWLNSQIHSQQVFEVDTLGDLPPEARLEREYFAAQGIQSLIAVPLLPGKRVIGYLGLDAIREQRTGTQPAFRRKRYGRFFSETLHHGHAEEKTRECAWAVKG